MIFIVILNFFLNYRNQVISDNNDNNLKYENFPLENINEICCICLENLHTDLSIKYKCGHSFHLKCANDWHKRNSKCCLCLQDSVIEKYYSILV